MTQTERIKIAQELHDGIAQDLVALSYSLDLLLADAQTPPSTRIELRTLIFTVSTMIEKVRKEIFDLRVEQPLTMEQSLRSLLAETKSTIELRFVAQECDLSSFVEAELLAISRELIRNSIKHSGASVIEISIKKSENGTTYSYADNGKGIDPLVTSGYGIRGVNERCISIESELTVTSDERGSHYLILIP